MSTPYQKSDNVRKKLKLLFKVRRVTIASLILLTVSALFLTHQATRVVVAMDRWVHLKEAGSSPIEIEKALESLDNEEAALITPIGFTIITLAIAFHSVNLMMIPKKCFYCGKWAQARKVQQTPDQIFHFHEKCKVKKEK